METRSIFSPPRSIGPNEFRGMPKEPPACVQNAMFNKDKKPFSYLPGGLDLSEIKSEKMAKRLIRNAMSPGVQEKPKPPSFTPTGNEPTTPPIKSCQFYNMPVAVFPVIQLPPNPKELLRRTSGPYCRSESVDRSQPEKQMTPPRNGCSIESPQINSSTPPIERELVSTKIQERDSETTTHRQDSFRECPKPTAVVNPVEVKKSGDVVEAKLVLPIENISKLTVVEVNDQDEPEEETHPIKEEPAVAVNEFKDEPVAFLNEFKNEPVVFLNGFKDEPNSNGDKNESPVEDAPQTDGVLERDDPENCLVDKEPENCSEKVEVANLSENLPTPSSPPPKNMKNDNVIERVISPMRRSTEAIKGLSDDLDNLPTLNICTKRFSFLRDSPPKEQPSQEKSVEDDDPFRLLTGIPPKISLIDEKDNYQKSFAPQTPWKEIQKENSPIDFPVVVPENKKPEEKPVDRLFPTWKDEIRAPSPFTKDDDFWKKDWNGLSRKESLTLKDILKDDTEPAWKKEIREIALRKAEAKEESKDCNKLISPEKETSPFSAFESKPYQPTWSVQNNINLFSRAPDNLSYNPPAWSQTLRPKSWKEREAERAKDIQQQQYPPPPPTSTWSTSMPPKKTLAERLAKNNSEASSGTSSPIGKTTPPEITVEVVNHQPTFATQVMHNTNGNGYIYPWESSSESSVAFSPEPRTPTPQSRNSPYNLHPNYPYAHAVGPREYGTLSFQPKRRPPSRSCPIQSRSFKYLQMLTGTEDTYEDDEPFVPQPPQHAYPRPGNF